jgi:hypothetical protein
MFYLYIYLTQGLKNTFNRSQAILSNCAFDGCVVTVIFILCVSGWNRWTILLCTIGFWGGIINKFKKNYVDLNLNGKRQFVLIFLKKYVLLMPTEKAETRWLIQ